MAFFNHLRTTTFFIGNACKEVFGQADDAFSGYYIQSFGYRQLFPLFCRQDYLCDGLLLSSNFSFWMLLLNISQVLLRRSFELVITFDLISFPSLVIVHIPILLNKVLY